MRVAISHHVPGSGQPIYPSTVRSFRRSSRHKSYKCTFPSQHRKRRKEGWLVGWLDVSCSCSSSSGLIHIVLCLIVVAVFELTCRLVQSERKKKPRNDDIQSISGTFSIIFHLNLSLLLLWDQPSPALIPVDYLLHDLSMKSNKIIPLRRNMKKHPRQSFFTTTLNFWVLARFSSARVGLTNFASHTIFV